MARYYVTLRIDTNDDDRYDAPDQWDWHLLIDCLPEQVSILACGKAQEDI